MNIDESWISETDYSRRMWYPPEGAGTMTEKQINPRLALIAALDSDGNTYFALTHAITNSDIMLLFLSNLARKLDLEQHNWRDNLIILLDGARYHTSEDTRTYLKKLNMPVIFSAPYCYSTAPIELMFGGMKDRELCPYN